VRKFRVLTLMLFVTSSLLAQSNPRCGDNDIAAKHRLIDAKGYNWIAVHTIVNVLSLEEFRKLLGYTPPKGYEEWLFGVL
jgi:hypothetical protein